MIVCDYNNFRENIINCNNNNNNNENVAEKTSETIQTSGR